MELNEFITLVKKYIVLIVIFALIGAVLGVSSTKFFSSGFNHQRFYFLTDPSPDIQENQDYRSENYFLQEKSRNFTDTAVAILDSPDFKNEVLGPGDLLQVRKVAPQLVRLNLISQSADSNFSKLQKVTVVFNRKIQNLTESTPTSQLKPVGSVSSPSYSSLNSRVLLVFGAILGAAFALLIIGLKNYHKI